MSSVSTDAPPTPGGSAGTRPSDPAAPGHQWQIDIVRLLTFTAVISVHSLAFTELPSNTVAAGVMMLLQFGREVFFAVTGFVLVVAAGDRVPPTLRFWRRRIPAVAVPYLAWSVIYYGEGVALARHGHLSWSVLGTDLADGGAKYHLYFLLVTLQLYLVFPLVARLVRATATHAVAVLVVVGAANLAWLGILQYVPDPGGDWGWLWVHGYEILPSYTVWVLVGAYAAVHRHAVDRAVRAHPRRVLVVGATAAAVALGVYAWQLGWMAPRTANAVLQPAVACSCVAAGLGLYLLGRRWADGPRRAAGAVAAASEISFGVYLAHPLVLDLLLRNGLGNGAQVVPAPLATVLAVVGALLGASLLTAAAARTPLSRLLTGRRRRSRPGRRVHETLSSRSGGSQDPRAGQLL